jgi:glycosyltransferase involved in cell wall biosynthesis
MRDQCGHIEYSVVLCTHNHADRLKTTLSGFERLRQPDAAWELLIINNASTDETEDILRNTDWRPAEVPVRIILESRLGLSNARNRGIMEADGSYVVFIDDDETPHEDWLVEYERAIRTLRPDALGGRIDVLFEQGDRPAWLQDELLGFLGQLSHGPEAMKLTEQGTPVFGGNFGFRKTVFDKIGRFDDSLGRKGVVNAGGEDTEIYRRLIKAGMDVRWIPDAVIYHRIQAGKLRKSYFHELHFRQGLMEGRRKRGESSRVPPLYLIPQLGRALAAALKQRFRTGSAHSLRKEMNVSYFAGYIMGWVKR